MESESQVAHVRAFLYTKGGELPVSEALLPTVPAEGTTITVYADDPLVLRVVSCRRAPRDTAIIFLDVELLTAAQEDVHRHAVADTNVGPAT